MAIIGDGGFWHSGLSASFSNMAFNKSDGLAAGGRQFLFGGHRWAGRHVLAGEEHQRNPPTTRSLAPVKGLGISWVREIDRTYDVARLRDTIREALTTPEKGPKVMIASSKCMLNKERRERPLRQPRPSPTAAGSRRPASASMQEDLHRRPRLHAAFGLPLAGAETAATIRCATTPSPIIDQHCVGCGNCGEVADAAILCPSFYRADVVHNPGSIEALVARGPPRPA